MESLRSLSNTSLEYSAKKKHAKLVQVVQNFFVKVSQVIVQARSLSDPKPLSLDVSEGSGASKINKWFNLYMANLESDWARLELKPWRSQTDLSHFLPMIIETFLDLLQLGPYEMLVLEDDHGDLWPVTEPGSKKHEVVIERWLIQFERAPSNSNSSIEELPLIYKHAIVLLRAIYGVVRLLPAYKLRKLVGKLGNKNLVLRNRHIDLKQQISSKGRIGLSKTIIPRQMLLSESHTSLREFAPVNTLLGTLRVSVAYRDHYKFKVQHHEERLLNHFILSDKETSQEKDFAAPKATSVSINDSISGATVNSNSEEVSSDQIPKSESHAHFAALGFDASQPRGSFDNFREKYSVLPCTSESLERRHSSPKPYPKSKVAPPSSSHINPQRPGIQPFKVGSLGSSSPPLHSNPGHSSSMERRISVTSNRSGSNASLVALLRNPRGSNSSATAPTTIAISGSQAGNNPLMPRSISSSQGVHLPPEDTYNEHASSTPRFSSSFGSRQSRRFSNNSGKSPGFSNAEANASLFGTSVELRSSDVPFSGLYEDGDISSFVQMIDGTSDLRLSNSNQESRLETPNSGSGSHFEALSRFHLLKSHYQQLSESVNASLILQQNQNAYRAGSQLSERFLLRKQSRSSSSPAPSITGTSYDRQHLPSILSRLDQAESEAAPPLSGPKSEYFSRSGSNSELHDQATSRTREASSLSRDAISGMATSPSLRERIKKEIKYENVFEEDDDAAEFYTDRGAKRLLMAGQEMSFDNDDLLFEMTDTR